MKKQPLPVRIAPVILANCVRALDKEGYHPRSRAEALRMAAFLVGARSGAPPTLEHDEDAEAWLVQRFSGLAVGQDSSTAKLSSLPALRPEPDASLPSDVEAEVASFLAGLAPEKEK